MIYPIAAMQSVLPATSSAIAHAARPGVEVAARTGRGPLIAAGIGVLLLGVGAYLLLRSGDSNPPPAPSPAAQAPAAEQPDTATDAPAKGNAPFRLEAISTMLQQPVHVASAPGDDRLFVVEQKGRIVALTGSQRETYLNIEEIVGSGGERGLLSVAFHPNFADNGRLYVNFTDKQGDTNIVEYTAKGDTIDPGSARTLLTIDQPYANHNGGQLAFGPDGLLYIGMGDGGSGGDPQNRSQDPDDLLGKILRIDVDRVDRGSEYATPHDNAPGAAPEVYATGVRNPWRFSFDSKTGDLYMGDVGQGNWEEIDYLPAGTPGGTNFGWDVNEGTHSFEDKPMRGTGPVVDPIVEYDHSEGYSVTGGVVYRGTAIPELQGQYLYADFGADWIRTLQVANGAVTKQRSYEGQANMISSFGYGPDGEVYVTELGGVVSKLVPAE